MTIFDIANLNNEYAIESLFRLVEEESGQSFNSLRAECAKANATEGRYSNELREKIAQVRRAIEGMDAYERVTRGRPTVFGYRLNTYGGLNLPWEVKSKLKEAIWKYVGIDKEKDKDSVGMSIWKSFYEGVFWTSHRH